MDQLTITFITASTALIAGVASPIVSISVARRQFKASVISNNRERWIEALREAISEYISLVASAALIARHAKVINDQSVYANEEMRKTAEHIMLVRTKIVLMTNPTKSSHRDLCQSIDVVYRALVDNLTMDRERWRSQLDAITLAGHAVLEAEWGRVKRGD
jgi:hypothetical protein